MDILDIKDFSIQTLGDEDYVLATMSDGSAARVSVAALKTLFSSTLGSESGTSDSARGVPTRLLTNGGTGFAPATNSDSVSTGNGETLTQSLVKLQGELQGDSSEASANNSPFVKLGDYNSWDAANTALTALLATTEQAVLKYQGRLRFTVQGGNFECYMFCRNVTTPVWVQAVSGAVQANAAGTALEHGERYATFIRDCNGATVSVWEEAYATLAELEQVRLTALGLGSEKPLDAAVTCINSSTVGRLFPRWTGEADTSLNGWLNDLFVTLDRDPKYNGYYIIKRGNRPQLGSLQVGGYVHATGYASCTQIIRGNFALTSGPDADGYAWSEHGITNRLIPADHVIGEWYRTSRRNADGTFSVINQWTRIFYSN